MTRLQRLASIVALCAVFALHIAIRLRPAFDVFGSSEAEPLLAGPDSFCHAHRARLLFEQFPRFVFHDRFMFHPQGTIAEWPLGFDWSAVSVLRLFTSSWEVAVWWLPWTTLVISLAGLSVFIALARSVLPPTVALVVSACFALNLAFVRVSTLAELDHHVVETLCVALLLWLPIASVAWSRAQAVAFGMVLAWMIWNSTLLAFVVFGFASLWMLAVQWRWSPAPALAHFSLALLVPLFVLSFVEAQARGAYFAFNTLSLLHPLLIGLPLAALAVSARVSSMTIWSAAVLLCALAMIVAPGALPWILGFLTAHDSLIGNINESKPLFYSIDGFTWSYAHAFFGPAYALFPFACGMLLRAYARDDRSSQPFALPLSTLLFALALFVLSLSQKRFAHLFVPAFVLVIGVWAARVKRQGLMLALVTLLLVEPVVVLYAETAYAISDTSRAAVRVAHTLRRAAAGRDDLGVSAPPNLGSAINYAGRLPVVTTAFFYPRYLRADLELRSFEVTADLIAYLRRQHLGFLVAVDDARYRTMLLRMLGDEAVAARAAVWERTPCHGALLRYAFDRIACGLESPPELALLTVEQTTQDRRRLWRRISVFQVRP